MPKQLYSITIHNKDLKVDHTASSLIEDKLAQACGQWTEDELCEANLDYSDKGAQYYKDNFNYEDAYIEYLNKQKENYVYAVANLPGYKDDTAQRFIDSELKLGAFIALEYSELFEAGKENFEEKIRDSDYRDDDSFMVQHVPALAKECAQAEQDFWDDLHREWLHGDRDSAGILKTFAKWIGADSIKVNLPKEEIILSFEHDAIAEELEAHYGDSKAATVTVTNIKAYVIESIDAANETNEAKRQAEREKRKTEYAKTKAYKDERAQQDRLEREAKLKAMKK